MPRTTRTCFFLLIALLAARPASLQAQPTIFDEMYGKEVLEVTLTTDIQQFIANKNTDTYQPARIQFKGRAGEEHAWDIRLRPRGRYRRRVCDFPPIKIKYPKKEIKQAGYAGHNDLKLVTHCLSDPLGDELVMREHLVYLLYRELSPYAFRTQLVHITYIDNQGGAPLARYGILLEDEDELAERYRMEVCDECYGYQEEDFEDQARKINQLFQYLIGNADWSLRMQRNIKILQREEDQQEDLLFVPYDFDFSEMVNAPYQVEEPISFPELSAADQPVAQHFYRHREVLAQLVNNYRLLDEKARRQCLRRIEKFYRKLEKQLPPSGQPASLYSGAPGQVAPSSGRSHF
jgi:hypothetical protein